MKRLDLVILSLFSGYFAFRNGNIVVRVGAVEPQSNQNVEAPISSNKFRL
jgi:hypothetical protein